MDAPAHLPLTPLSTAILLALAGEDLHGYALMQAVEAQSEGILRPGTGTLYAALDRLETDGLIAEVRATSDDPRRGRTYGISERGRTLLRAEARRLDGVLRRARQVDAAPDGGLAPEGGR